VLPCGRRQHATGDLPDFQNGRGMSHDRSYHPQIYWIEPGSSPRMRGVVKQSLTVAGPQTHGDDFMHLPWVMCLRSPAYSEDGTEGKHYRQPPRATTDVKATDLPPVPTN